MCRAKLVVGCSLSTLIVGYVISLMGIMPGEYRLETERCMEDLGCFSIYGNYTLRPFNLLPQYRDVVDTRFILYNSDYTYTEAFYNDIQTIVKGLHSGKGLVIVLHGWISSRHDADIQNLVKTLVDEKGEELNVMLVEWERGSVQTYPQAAANTRVVGAEIARLLRLVQTKILLKDVHLVGISLGAHISGTCGSLLPGIGRITALDAAGPLFENYPPSIRLDPTDALFVDAIHTDGDDFYKVVMAEGGLGIHHSIGHADFYPNGGHTQPHCNGVMSRTLTDITSGSLQNVQLKKLVACDHELSLDYFAQSILTSHLYTAYACDDDQQGFIDGRCSSTNYMGYDAYKPSTDRKYYLHMSDNRPYRGSHFIATVTVNVSNLVCLRLTLKGANGVAGHIQQPGFKKSCSLSSTQCAMLYSDVPISTLHSLNITWEDNAASHSQVLVHGLTQLTLVNASVSYGDKIYYSCTPVLLGFTLSVTMPLSTQKCTN